MTSQTDLDQGGTGRQWERKYLGPSVGWVLLPGLNPFGAVTVAGTYTLSPDTTLVEVSCNGSVTLILPSAVYPTVPPVTVVGSVSKLPITIVDIGGFAANHPITIQAYAGENIVSFASIQISVNYGGYTLNPSNKQAGWSIISP